MIPKKVGAHMQEGLYEDNLHIKAAAVEQISQLFRSVETFGALCQHPSLLPGLARHACIHVSILHHPHIQCYSSNRPCIPRVLREDGRRSAALTISILRAFFALSCFSQLHAQLAALRVGSLAMDALESALTRHNGRPMVIVVSIVELCIRIGCAPGI